MYTCVCVCVRACGCVRVCGERDTEGVVIIRFYFLHFFKKLLVKCELLSHWLLITHCFIP